MSDAQFGKVLKLRMEINRLEVSYVHVSITMEQYSGNSVKGTPKKTAISVLNREVSSSQRLKIHYKLFQANKLVIYVENFVLMCP